MRFEWPDNSQIAALTGFVLSVLRSWEERSGGERKCTTARPAQRPKRLDPCAAGPGVYK